MKVSEGFQVADSRNLPRVNYIMLLEFMHENDCYNVAETRSAKALLASREAYVDTAVGYVEAKRVANSCIVKCRVTPEHKVRAKLYTVTAEIDEALEKIIMVNCHDWAASAGGCKHAICFTIWLIKRSDEPSSTSTICYWNKPKLAAAVTDQKFIMAKNIGNMKTATENINMPVDLNMFSEECKRRKMDTGMILNYCGNRQPSLNDFSVYNLVLQFEQSQENHNYENFKKFSQFIITEDIINKIAESTKKQADSNLWHTMRQGRVTGSRIHEAIRCKTEDGALVQSILGGYKVPETKAIKRGKILEKEVLRELEKDFGPIQSTGMILISPIIGVSPDGLCEDFVIEIKCPLSTKTMTNYVKNNIPQDKCKAQVMLQMHAARKLKGVLCIADPSFEETKLIHKYWVEYDENYVKSLLIAAEEFWKNYIYNKIKD